MVLTFRNLIPFILGCLLFTGNQILAQEFNPQEMTKTELYDLKHFEGAVAEVIYHMDR